MPNGCLCGGLDDVALPYVFCFRPQATLSCINLDQAAVSCTGRAFFEHIERHRRVVEFTLEERCSGNATATTLIDKGLRYVSYERIGGPRGILFSEPEKPALAAVHRRVEAQHFEALFPV